MSDNELDIIEVLKIFLRNIHKIILISLLFGMCFFTISKKTLEPIYETSTTIMTEKSSNDTINSTYANLSKSNLLVSKVIKDLGLNMSYEEFSSKVIVESVPETRIINIKVNDTIPERAVDIANETAIELKTTIGKINKNRAIIIDKARTPKAPVNQDYKKDAIIGFILGFFIATLYVLIREFTDSRIKNLKTLKQKFDTPILGIIANGNKTDQKAKNISEDLYLQENAILSIRANLQLNPKYKLKKVIGVTSSKLNEGNERLLYSIAKSIASDGFKTIIADFNFDNSKLEEKYKLEESVNIYNWTNSDDLSISDNKTDFLYFLMPESIKKNISSKDIEILINKLSNKFDYVFINIPPVSLNAQGLVVSNFCEGIILNVKYNDTKEEELESTINNLKSINANIFGLVLTHFDKHVDPYRINTNY